MPLTTTAPHEPLTTRARIHDIKGASTELASYATSRSPRNEFPWCDHLHQPTRRHFCRMYKQTQCTQAQGTIRKAEQHLMSSAELFPRHATYLGLDTANGRIALTSHRTRPPPLLHMMMMTVTGCTVFQLPSAKNISSNGRYTRLTRISYTRNRPEADQPPGG